MEQHEQLQLLNKDFTYMQTFNVDQYYNFGKNYQEHNDLNEVIKKINHQS